MMMLNNEDDKWPKIPVIVLVILILLTWAFFTWSSNKIQEVTGVPERTSVLESWDARISPLGVEPGTVFARESIGSHTITVAVPVLDADFQYILSRDNVTCVEVHYQKNGGRLKPAFVAEPDTSAVYYFLKNSDLEKDGEVVVSWNDEDGAEMLCHGTALQQPGWAMRLTVLGSKSDQKAAKSVFLEDCFGGFEQSHNTQTLFSENSLHSFQLGGDGTL